MATEILTIPEAKLAQVIAVIRAGLQTVPVDDETYEALTNWCDEYSDDRD